MALARRRPASLQRRLTVWGRTAPPGPPCGPAQVIRSVDFAGTAAVGDWLEGRADVQRVGSTLAFVNAYVSVGDRRIIRASFVFAVSPSRKAGNA